MAACNTRIVRRSRHLLKDVPAHFAYYEVMRAGGRSGAGVRIRVYLSVYGSRLTYLSSRHLASFFANPHSSRKLKPNPYPNPQVMSCGSGVVGMLIALVSSLL